MEVDSGYQWLEQVAHRMRSEAANGAAPSPERLTVRELLQRFKYQRRGDSITSHIRNGLEKHRLSTDPDFAVPWIDSTIAISLDSDASAAPDSGYSSDPAHRIGTLEAANRAPVCVHPDNPLNAATTIMQLHDYSQLPVMTSARNVSGIISWTSIGIRLSLGRHCENVRDCMEAAEIVSVTTPLHEAIATIAEHGYVLVRGIDQVITGIVTATDLSFQFMQLAGPFLFVGEIEGHLRNLIHAKFTLEQLRAASLTEEGRTIEGSGDLTLGGYCRLLENKENWQHLALPIDRVEFVKHLDAVRQIRNDVMHFNPDGLSDDQTKKLRDIARFFEDLVRIGAM